MLWKIISDQIILQTKAKVLQNTDIIEIDHEDEAGKIWKCDHEECVLAVKYGNMPAERRGNIML